MLPMSTWRRPGDAGDRRLDLGVVELGLRVGDRGFVGGDLGGELGDGGALGVGLLPRREFAELGVALKVEIGVGEIRLVLLLLGLGLVERGLERAGVDLDQQIALVDHLALGEGDLVDLAVNPGPDLYGVEALNRAEAGQVDREVDLLDRRNADGNGGRARRTLLSGLGFSGLRRAEFLPTVVTRGGHGRDDQNPEDRP